MNLEKQTLKLKVKKVVKRVQGLGPELYVVYLTVATIHPKDKDVKQSAIYPACIFTSKHKIPTHKGYVPADKLKVGDIILVSLDLITS
jgi:hypothetical protein